MLTGKAGTFAEGLKDIVHIVFGIIFGAGLAVTMWKKDGKK